MPLVSFLDAHVSLGLIAHTTPIDERRQWNVLKSSRYRFFDVVAMREDNVGRRHASACLAPQRLFAPPQRSRRFNPSALASAAPLGDSLVSSAGIALAGFVSLLEHDHGYKPSGRRSWVRCLSRDWAVSDRQCHSAKPSGFRASRGA
jgi:hypothetical protein